ncbi:MAG: putative bifunctional diguanylate cyclase/phosphodiesterase [Janthinobacterium lividum]
MPAIAFGRIRAHNARFDTEDIIYSVILSALFEITLDRTGILGSIYTPPRSAALGWLIGSAGADNLEKQSWLISNMFTRTGSLVGAVASEMIVAVTAVSLHPTYFIIAWPCASFAILLWRLAIIAMGTRAAARGWDAPSGLLAVSSLVWATELGVGGMLCNLSGNPTLQLLSNACTCSIIAGVSVRNASTPRLAVVQMILAMTLICIGAAFAPQLWIKILLVQAPFFVLGLTSLCQRTGKDLVSMLDAQQRNAILARRDSLTSLPNRVHVAEEMQELLGGGGRVGRFALIWVDLDGFKAVNDTLGHAAGDAVLVETGRRLQAVCAPTARSTLARLGGDEFLMIAPYAGQEEAQVMAETVAAAIRIPHALPNAPDVRLDASIGISLFPEHGNDTDTLLAAADKALYAVKASGKARWQTYDPLLHAGEDDLILFRSELAKALSEGENQLQLYYQPVIRLSDGKLTGREALVRWNHPIRGLVSPGMFVPMAEASGLIIPLGEWVLRRACADAARWTDDAKVAVNVSPFQLRTERLSSVVVQALDQAGLPPERLEIEVTETVLLSRDQNTTRNMQELRELGIEMILDDFGTGFSSLSNLCSFVFDRIKIDGSFVREALHRRDCAAVVHATVELARKLGIPTTAECIETQEQLDFVRACGCNEVQGYLLGRPEPLSSTEGRYMGTSKLGLMATA